MARSGDRSTPRAPGRGDVRSGAGPPDEDVASRSELLPEERAAGSDDPAGQAAAILEESEDRVRRRSETAVEHRRSPDTVDPS